MAKPTYEKLVERVGVPIDIATRDAWYKEVKKTLKESQEEIDFCYVCSGDSVVVGVRHGDGEICVWDAKIRREADFSVGGAE